MFPKETKQSMNIPGEGGEEERGERSQSRRLNWRSSGWWMQRQGLLGELQASVTYALRWRDKNAH